MFAAVFAAVTFAIVGSALVFAVRQMEETERLIQKRLGILAQSEF